VRKYEIHLSASDALDDLVDPHALFRNIASAVPDVCFRERFGYPMPLAVLDELERIEDTNEIAAGRPALMPRPWGQKRRR
jgi:hypothetical protein